MKQLSSLPTSSVKPFPILYSSIKNALYNRLSALWLGLAILLSSYSGLFSNCALAVPANANVAVSTSPTAPVATLVTATTTKANGMEKTEEAFDIISRHVPNATKVGEARMTYLFWDVYDAELFAPNGQWSAEVPFALSLTYLRSLDGEAIAERSIEEMQKQGFNDKTKLTQWLDTMRELFPNVQDQHNLIGIQTHNGHASFYHNQTYLGTIADAEFSKQFFAIWLNEKSSEPKLRKQLLGASLGEQK